MIEAAAEAAAAVTAVDLEAEGGYIAAGERSILMNTCLTPADQFVSCPEGSC